ncbi:MAG: hypothetical protein LBD23_05180 [Oscillospiraceae bacterium]|jgi:hypothetical protein|nr:hypothetical protein [Oscillospiraceae bacterium]
MNISIRNRIKNVLGNFGQSPIEGISMLASVAVMAIAVITVIILLILFILDGGYGLQINLLRESLGNLFSIFTTGKTVIYFDTNSMIIHGSLLGISFLAAYIFCLINLNVIRRVMAIILFVLVIITGVIIPTAFYMFMQNTLPISDDIRNDIIKMLYMTTREYYPIIDGVETHYIEISANSEEFLIIISIYIVITIILFISFFLTIREPDDNEILKMWFIALFVTFAAAPLALLALQNIIPLVIIVVIIVIIYFIYIFFDSSGSTDSGGGSISSGYSGSSSQSSPAPSPKNTYTTPKNTSTDEAKTVTEEKLESNTKLIRTQNIHGANIIQGDRGYGTFYVCTQKEFDTGKVVIFVGNKKVNKI